MNKDLLDKVVGRMESSSKTPWSLFILGVLAAVLLWLVVRSRKKLLHRKEYEEARGTALRAVAVASKSLEEQTKLLDAARLHRTVAKALAVKISKVDKRIAEVKKRIDSARSFDDLEGI